MDPKLDHSPVLHQLNRELTQLHWPEPDPLLVLLAMTGMAVSLSRLG